MKKALVFDENGDYTKDKIVNDDYIPLENEVLVEIDTPLSFYSPKLENGDAVEGKSKADIEAEELLKSLEPSEDEVTQAELQIAILNTMMEVGLL